MEKRIFRSELRTLKEIAETLNECTVLDTLLATVLQKLLQITSLETGWIFLIDEKGEYRLAASESLPPALTDPVHQPMACGECWCVDKFRNGELKKASNIMHCKRLENAVMNDWGDTYGLTYHATVPLASGDERFGVLNVAVTNKEKFGTDDLAILESVAYQIGSALKRLKLAVKEQEMKITEERNRLARDLHDSVNQLLYSISVTSRAGMSLTGEEKTKEIFSDIQRISQHAQTEMKALIWQLRPDGLKEGILSSLIGYGEMLGLAVDANVEAAHTLPSELEEALWRIGQEAFNNAVKYAGTNEIRLQVTIDDNKIVTMQISDSGNGFMYKESGRLPTIGINSMKERAEAFNGTFTCKSSIGKGTTILVTLPLERG